MSNSDERQQATALLILGIFVCLWISHYFSVYFPSLPGTVDLRRWLRFWNKPIIIHWPSAAALFIVGPALVKRIQREMTAKAIRRQQEEANWLKAKLGLSANTSGKHQPVE